MTPDVAATFYRAIDCYNRADYLAAQELFEAAHAASEPADRPLVRALLMLACGMHLHFQRGGGRGTANLFRQTLVVLDDYRPRHLGVEVDELSEALQAYLDDLNDRRKPGAGFFDRWLAPRIRYRAEAWGARGGGGG
jgi:predicted metal-dependent hydrolase